MTDANPSPPAAAPSDPPLRGLRLWAVIAEIVAAAAVVVSLVFVGVQVAQSNVLARSAAQQKQSESIREIARLTAENPGVVDIFMKAYAGDALTPAERSIIDNAYTYAERTWEMLYFQYQNGMVDRDLWEAQRRQARIVQSNPLNKAFWERNRDFYTTRYREFRDAETAASSPVAPPPAQVQPAAPQPATQQ